MLNLRSLITVAVLLSIPAVSVFAADGETPEKIQTLPGTKPLTLEGDIASYLVDGVDKFLLRKISESVAKRKKYWKRDFSSAEAYNKSIEPNRKRLARMLGIRDQRIAFDAPELVATTNRSALVGKGDGFEVYAVRWPVLGHPGPNWNSTASIHGEGLLLVPKDKKPIANIIAIPDADQTPEQIVGLTKGVHEDSQFARRLAESGCRVLVPMLISREMKKRNGRANLTNREYLYRSAFEMGRHLIGYEVQKVLAAVDWFTKDAGDANPKIGVIGYGEGGMIALYAGALDTRIDATYVSGYFGPRENIWQEPLDRNVFGLLREFGDAELASMFAGRTFLVDDARQPDKELPGEGGAPGRIVSFTSQDVFGEFDRTSSMLVKNFLDGHDFQVVIALEKPWPRDRLLGYFFEKFRGVRKHRRLPEGEKPQVVGNVRDPAVRQQRQLDEIDRHNQLLLRESPFVRKQFMSKLDTSSVEKYKQSVEQYRKIFAEDVIGKFDEKLLPFNPRTRKAYDEEKWTGYEVVLDVFPDVIAYGVLLVPKDIKEGEKRPVVVCQHGLEGRPQDIISGDHRAYHDFAAKLAERGFITFAPQNLYLFRDRFRTLQRKANPLGKTLYSIIVPQHQQIVDWLQSLPYVDPDRVAFYGLSYGGKTAMRVPALVTDYCLSICSADFNEWVRKNASTRHAFSYVWTGEYEIFEFDLGSTFNYAEMAALICPRPFMVERGHFDGVGEDEWVAYEFAKVRKLYQAKLGIGDRTEIEWFVGPHTINGKGTYAFLHKHLNWPQPGE
ncbi:MAG: dienelactone hydrolase family protein [Planctomycetes bacterium]|nr:dienelactone hydrolase family protein [Planctomycetota bacterium]